MPNLEPPDNHILDAATGWLMLGNADEARHEFEQLSPTSRQHSDALDFEWRWLAHEERWEEAVEAAQRLIERHPKRVDAWIHRSFALHELRRTREAFDLLLPVVKKFPRELTIPYNLACYTCQLGDLPVARKWLKRAWVILPDREDRMLRLRAALEDEDLRPLWSEIRDQLEALQQD